MKKLLCVLMAIFLCIGFTACGETETGNSSLPDVESSTPTSSDNTSSDNKPQNKGLELFFEDYHDFANDGAVNVTSADTEKLEVKGTEIHAQGITEQPVAVTVEYENGSKETIDVTVKKAKLNIIVVCGQSNAVGETAGAPATANKYLSTKCVKGSTFLWTTKNAPQAFSGGAERDGFRAGLAAEWYELSKKAGKPEKTVIIWEEEQTATSALSINEFLQGGEKASVEKTIKMVNACYDYYEKGKGAEGFEIVNCGLFWMQGERDIDMDEATYYQQFGSMWTRLTQDTNNRVKYCAFMRIRGNAGSLKPVGPLTAQKKFIEENANMYMATVLTEQWNKGSKAKIKVDISKYHIFDEAQYKDIISNGTLTELQENIYGGLHYTRLGFNIIGADAAYTMYPLLHK